MTKAKTISTVILLLFSGLVVYYFYPEQKLPSHTRIDYIKILKSKRELIAFSDGQVIKKYIISLGEEPEGKKQFSGDNKTPEGIYFINGKNPSSKYHKNLGVSYPNQNDIETAKKLKKNPGGDIKIHGIMNGFGFLGKFQRWYDWTEGCIALTNEEIDELYYSVEINTKVSIEP